MTPLRRRMIEDMTLRNFAPRTIQVYVERVATFARYFRTSPERLGPEHIRGYLLHLIQERHASWSYYNQARSALQFLYRVTLGRVWVVDDVVCPEQPRKLPVVLSLQEVARFFEAITHLKHRALLMTAYAAGLRVSEVTRLRVADIDSQRMVLRIRQAKGQKDRFVGLSPRLLEILRQYWKAVRPGDYLFPGARPDQPLSTGSVHRVCRAARQRCGLDEARCGMSMTFVDLAPHPFLRSDPFLRSRPGDRPGAWCEEGVDIPRLEDSSYRTTCQDISTGES